ncbi:MAG TPA: cystathionine beta-synthase, partial [Planctomycetes bacterium]|nr:cystathionine beta-synthase [Planctomycetota bacterium]
MAAAVGDTPLVRLNRVVEGLGCEVYAKLEFMNPMGSVKDRVARHLVAEAAKDGRLQPGDTIVEASSGNTAMGLAMMAVLGGYRCKIAVRDRTSREKLSALRALGVELELVDATLPPEHPESYNRVVERMVRETPRSYFPDQHNNRENNAAHYATTGPELLEQLEGQLDVLVAGVGTGGTISGVARYLKERIAGLRVVGVDPVGSIFTPYFRTGQVPRPGPYLLEGLGDEEPIECVEWEWIDEMLQVESGEAMRCARELALQEAIFAGGS